MDYSLGAVKMYISQLKPAKQVVRSDGVAFAIGSLIFQRVWLQGTLVPGLDKASFSLDDGSGVLPLQLGPESFRPGTYVLAVGAYLLGANGLPFLLVHKIVDLSNCSDRDKYWRMEVAEIHDLFYNKLMNTPTD